MVRKNLTVFSTTGLNALTAKGLTRTFWNLSSLKAILGLREYAWTCLQVSPLLKINEWVSENLGIKGDYIVSLLIVSQGKKKE